MGASPSFKKIHLRKQGENAIYAVGLSAFDFYSSAPNWLKKDLLALSDVQSISSSEFNLQKSAKGWIFSNSSEPVEQNKADDLATAFTKLAVLEPADALPAGERHVVSLGAAGQNYQFTLVKADNQYFIQRADRPQAFKINQADYERISKPVKSDFIAKPAATPTNTDPVGQLLQQSTQGVFPAKPRQ